MLEAPRWSHEQLAAAVERATEIFRTERMEEPLDAYLEAFDDCQSKVEEMFETTVDLTTLDSTALDVLTNPQMLTVVRYLTGPPISADDLKTVAEANSLVAARLQSDPEAVRRIIQLVRVGLDRRRFPWVSEGREPDEAERKAAILASAALMATQHVGTGRRSAGKRVLEGLTEGALTGAGFLKVTNRSVRTFTDAPQPGQFSGEALLGERKADFIVRLWDNRVMPLECKASNSATNSVKRVNNDTAAKAEGWLSDFGATQIVPAAVLSGVFRKVHNLVAAQARGLTLFWGHDLKAMTDWVEQTRSG